MQNMKALYLKLKSYKNQKYDRRTDRQADGQTDRQRTDKVFLKWRSASLSPQKLVSYR